MLLNNMLYANSFATFCHIRFAEQGSCSFRLSRRTREHMMSRYMDHSTRCVVVFSALLYRYYFGAVILEIHCLYLVVYSNLNYPDM